ncbi:glycerate kinase [Stomatohabitans albus]
MTHFVIAPDKFKGTLSGQDFCTIVQAIVEDQGGNAVAVPLADGGDGTLDAFGGPNRYTDVTGPQGERVTCPWRLDGDHAIIETALCSGLVLAGGTEANDAMTATSKGSGEIIAEAVKQGAKTIVVGIGGSAMTDGGEPALRAIQAAGGPWPDVDLLVACDVQTRFVQAAEVFAPQKGATPEQVELLTQRLEKIRQTYRDEFGLDVQDTPGSGAAGGLGGALLALGAQFRPGIDLVAEQQGFYDHLNTADVVITGEGRLDATSLAGKVVGSVIEHTSEPVIVIVGQADADVVLPDHVTLVDLSAIHGLDQAMHDPAGCIRATLPGILQTL